MKFLTEIAEQVCWHVSSECSDELNIVTVAAVVAQVTQNDAVGIFARVRDRIKSFGPYRPEWLTVVERFASQR